MSDHSVRVVLLESLSYSGTTWLNLVLGAHEDALALGPADRLFTRLDPEDACRVHGANCALWPTVLAEWNHRDNLFEHIGDRTKRRVVILNNPSHPELLEHLAEPALDLRRVRVVRDARGVFSSWLRLAPEAAPFRDGEYEPFAAVAAFAPWIESEFGRMDPDDPSVLFCPYDAVVTDTATWLERLSAHVGLTYDTDALRYWEHELHPVAGNQGTISMIKFAEGIEVPAGYRDRELYEERFRTAVGSGNFENDAWRRDLDPTTIALLDLVCADYQRCAGLEPAATAPELVATLEAEIDAGGVAEDALFAAALDRRRRGIERDPGWALIPPRSAWPIEVLKRVARRLPDPIELQLRRLHRSIRP